MTLFQDVRFGLRMLAKDPGFTAVVIVTLALGIGANTTVFTLVNAVLFRGLPYEQPDRIMSLSESNLSRRQDRTGISYPDFLDWRTHSKKFQGLAAFNGMQAVLTDRSGLPENFRGARVTANCFSLLGQKPLIGRDFMPDEDKGAATPVAIIGHSLWKSVFGGETAVLGQAVQINNVSTIVIGVMPDAMKFPGEADVWIPLIPTGALQERGSHQLNVLGRLSPGATVEEARAELTLLAKTLEKEYPKTNTGVGAVVQTFNEAQNGGRIRAMFLTLLGAVAFVLLIACANVANLLLARSLSRAKEISVRSALGASRLRIVRQLLVESTLMGVVGGALGLPLAIWGVRAFDLATQNVGKPSWIHFTMDYTVFGYLAAICVGSGILFGLAPALHISKLDVNHNLKEGGRSGTGGARIKYLSGVMVVVEVALALVLMAGAGLMIRSFLKLYGLDLGINTNNLLTMRLSLPDLRYPTPESRVTFADRALARFAAIPGVEAVALVSNLPLQGGAGWQFEVDGQAPMDKEKLPRLTGLLITTGYFQTVGLRAVRGRLFDDADGSSGKQNVIVNQSFATKYFPAQDPLGKRLRLSRDTPQPWLTVVGVVPDVLQNDPTRTDPNTIVYLPNRQDPLRGAAVIARTRVPPSSLVTAFRKEVRGVDTDLPVFEPRTMLEIMEQQRWPFRVFGTLFTVFALIGLTLSAVGIYAVVAYSVSRRTQEIGVRMALGASAGSVLRLILSLGFTQLAIGLAIGIGAAFGLTRVLNSVLAVSATDPLTFTAISLLLAAIGGIACWAPARKASRIDPMIALRYE